MYYKIIYFHMKDQINKKLNIDGSDQSFNNLQK